MKKVLMVKLMTFSILILPILPLDCSWWARPIGGG